MVSSSGHTKTTGQTIMIAAIGVYQMTFSALMGRSCRHLPTCSHYTIEAIERHGSWRGFWLGLARIVRCNPFGSSGFDPVPERLADQRWRFWRYGVWRGPKENGPDA